MSAWINLHKMEREIGRDNQTAGGLQPDEKDIDSQASSYRIGALDVSFHFIK